MTITSQTSSTTAIGNGVQTAFTYNFFVPGATTSDQTNFQVYVTDTSGNITTLTTSQYSVVNSLSKSSPGGTLTYSPALTLNYSITISRVLPFTQLVTLANQGGFYPDVVDTALDNLEMQIQQVDGAVIRSIQAPTVDPTTINLTLPSAVSRAGQACGFDSSGNVIALSTLPSTSVSSAMQPVVSAASIAAAQTLLGIGTAGQGLPYGQIYAGSSTYGFSTSNTAAANTTALNAAIAAAVAQSGGTVVLPGDGPVRARRSPEGPRLVIGAPRRAPASVRVILPLL